MAKQEGYPDPNNRREGPYPDHPAHEAGAGVDAADGGSVDLMQQLRVHANGGAEAGGALPESSAAPSAQQQTYSNPQFPTYYADAQHTLPGNPYLDAPPLAPEAQMGAAPVASMGMGSVPAPAVGTPTQTGAAQSPTAEEHTGRRATKSSRACDECRRKKVRCDKDPASEDPCSNCKKTNGTVCAFSREPQKRGPNKGYIRELTDRVSKVEGYFKPPGDEGSPTPAPGGLGFPRKRSAEVAGFEPPPFVPRTSEAPDEAPDKNATNGIEPFTDLAIPAARQPNLVVNPNGFPSMAEQQNLTNYYRLVHPTWPIFPDDATKIRYLATYCHEKQREALFMAVEAMTSIPVSPVTGYSQGNNNRLVRVTNALKAYNKSKHRNLHSRHYATNVNHLYTLACLIVGIESLGSPRFASGHAPAVGELYGEARSILVYLKVNEGQKPDLGDAELVHELFVAARRIWWVFVTLGTMKAMGECTAPFFPSPRRFVAEDISLGHPIQQLGRLCRGIDRLFGAIEKVKDYEGSADMPIIDVRTYHIDIADSCPPDSGPVVRCLKAHTMLYIDRIRLAFLPNSFVAEASSVDAAAPRPVELDDAIVDRLERTVQAHLTEFSQLRTLSPLLPHFLALATLVLREVQRFGTMDDQKLDALVSAISATLATTEQEPQLASGWGRIVEAALDKVRGREPAKAGRTTAPQAWAVSILDGYIHEFAADL